MLVGEEYADLEAHLYAHLYLSICEFCEFVFLLAWYIYIHERGWMVYLI